MNQSSEGVRIISSIDILGSIHPRLVERLVSCLFTQRNIFFLLFLNQWQITERLNSSQMFSCKFQQLSTVNKSTNKSTNQSCNNYKLPNILLLSNRIYAFKSPNQNSLVPYEVFVKHMTIDISNFRSSQKLRWEEG